MNSFPGDIIGDPGLQVGGSGSETPFKYAVKTVGPKNQQIVLVDRSISPAVGNFSVRTDSVSSGSEPAAAGVHLINSGVSTVVSELNLESVLTGNHFIRNRTDIRHSSGWPDTAFLLRHCLNRRWSRDITRM